MTQQDLCPSDLRLVQLDGDELDMAAAALVRAHVGACDRCGMRLAELVATRRDFARSLATELPAWLAEAPARRRTKLPLRSAFGPVTALAAAALLMVLGSRGFDSSEPRSVRTKGAEPVLTVYVQRAGKVMRASERTRLHPADRLRFALHGVTGSRYAIVLSLDGAGRASTYVPSDGTPRKVTLGKVPAPLAGAVELDDVTGTERLFGLACEHPVDVAALTKVLERTRSLLPPIGCVATEVALEKTLPEVP